MSGSTSDARKRNTPTKKVVISECYGGFNISAVAAEAMGLDPEKYHREHDRTDPKLIGAVERLGHEASGRHANLKVVEIPADMPFHVHEYDGYETVHEDHRCYDSDGLQDRPGC